LVVELSNPRWQDGKLVFDIAAVEGSLPPAASYDHAALFVDGLSPGQIFAKDMGYE